MAARKSLVEGSVGRHIVDLAVPMTLGIVFIIAVNLIDTYFVGQLGTAQLAAMSFTFPVVTLVMSVAMGLGVGATSAISRKLGGGDENAARRLTTHAILLATLVVALVSGVGLLTQDLVFRALGADEALLPLLDEYMTIWYAGAVFLVVPLVGTGAFRAAGDAKTPAVIMMIVALANAVLDPPFIFGWGPIPAMGLAGAAIATLLARVIALVATLWILAGRAKMLDLHIPSWDELWTSWRAIMSVGIPAAVTNALVPVATAVLTALIAVYGSAAVAGYGVASRVEGLLLIPPMAVAAALTPIIGQNWGAHHPARVGRALTIARSFAMVWGAAMWVILALGGNHLADVFTDDPQVIDAARWYLWIVPLGYGAHGLVSVVSAAFNAVDRAVRSTILSATRSLALAIPLALAGGAWFGLPGLFGGVAAATVIASLIASGWSRGLTEPEPEPAQPVSAQTLSRPIPAITDAIDDLLQRARDAGIVASPRPINTIGFYAHGRELGHVHRTGHIDLHLPPAIHDALLDEGRAQHHRHTHDASWVTHRVDTDADVDEAVWLLRLCDTVARLCGGEAQTEDRAGARAALAGLDVPSRVMDAIELDLDRRRSA